MGTPRNPPGRWLTLVVLELRLGPCAALVQFRRRFGKKAWVNEECCENQWNLWDWDEAAQHLLSAPAHSAFRALTPVTGPYLSPEDAIHFGMRTARIWANCYINDPNPMPEPPSE